MPVTTSRDDNKAAFKAASSVPRDHEGFTSGLAEILAGWDSVLKTLDNVNQYTAQRAGVAPDRLVENCRANRGAWAKAGPSVKSSTGGSGIPFNEQFGQNYGVPDLEKDWSRSFGTGGADGAGSSSSSAAANGSAANGSDDANAAAADIDGAGSSSRFRRGSRFNGSNSNSDDDIFLKRLDVRVGREANRHLQAEVFRLWCEVRKEMNPVSNDQELDAARDLAARLRMLRTIRCKESLQCWRKVAQREALSACFAAWHSVCPSSTPGTVLSAEEVAASAAQNEELLRLRSELQASRASAEAAEAELAARKDELVAAEKLRLASEAELDEARANLGTMKSELDQAADQLSSTKAQLSKAVASSEDRLAAALKQVEQLRESAGFEAIAAARAQAADLTVKLARADADVAEARAEARRRRANEESLHAAFASCYAELQAVYGVLAGLEGSHQEQMKGLKGTIRDKEIALAQLYNLLQRFREPLAPVAVDEGLLRSPSKSSGSPSKAPKLPHSQSAPNISSGLPPAPPIPQKGSQRSLGSSVEDKQRLWAAKWH
eukprot:TRINITY_DN35904_c0_g1_i1.p1 TRINITY_DN35904_c0_g1~~TRINITY_DN35904_c0_g1_i1.p1  ORF type:complete len:550 (-),score=144.44 TRINITY_DN35904_c0_g1_i1:160-1809(-)